MKRNFLRPLCALCLTALAASIGAAGVFANSSDTRESTELYNITVAPDVIDADSGELLDGYVQRLFNLDNNASMFSAGIHTAGSHLTGSTKRAYDAIVKVLPKIASGEHPLSIISIGESGADLDVECSFEGTTYVDFDLTSLVTALLSDFPYEMYWYDKTVGVKASYSRINDRITYMELKFSVEVPYQHGPSQYEVDSTKAGNAIKAAKNAIDVVNDYKSKSDHEKLMAYFNYIRDAVTYDHDVAPGDFSTKSDVWQLVNVFDGDESTNVVCEGYSKAFQYLCDRSDFRRDIQCYSVSGTMIGQGSAGPHMWNILTMDDDRNYMADITNSDVGAIGQDGGLFLSGGNASTVDLYVTTNSGTSLQTFDCYTYNVDGVKISYVYDNNTVELWGMDNDSILTLSSSDYVSSDIKPGDANGDNGINAIDLAFLQRYLAGWGGYDDSTVNVAALDLNLDGKVNAIDAAVLARHLAGWGGYEKIPLGSN